MKTPYIKGVLVFNGIKPTQFVKHKLMEQSRRPGIPVYWDVWDPTTQSSKLCKVGLVKGISFSGVNNTIFFEPDFANKEHFKKEFGNRFSFLRHNGYADLENIELIIY